MILGKPAPFVSAFIDAVDEAIRQLQVLQGLMDGFDIALGLSALLLEAFLGFESTAFSGFGLFGSVSFHRGHGEFLLLVVWLD